MRSATRTALAPDDVGHGVDGDAETAVLVWMQNVQFSPRLQHLRPSQLKVPFGHLQSPPLHLLGAWQHVLLQNVYPGPFGQHDGFHVCEGTRLPSGRFSAGGPTGTQPLWILSSQQTPLIPLSGCATSAVQGKFLPLQVLKHAYPLS